MLDYVARLVRRAGTLLLFLLLALVVAQIVMRYAFGYTPLFADELGRTLFVWSVLAGSALAVREDSHIRVDFLLQYLPARLRAAWLLTVDLAILALFLVVTVTGVDAVLFAHGQTSMGLRLPLSYLWVAVPVFFAVSAVFAAAIVWARLGRRRPR